MKPWWFVQTTVHQEKCGFSDLGYSEYYVQTNLSFLQSAWLCLKLEDDQLISLWPSQIRNIITQQNIGFQVL
jgi:hypothetical protein